MHFRGAGKSSSCERVGIPHTKVTLVSESVREGTMKESKLIKGVVATVAVIAFAVPAVSSASEVKGRAVKVTYTDLNVDKESGAETLYRRLQQASKRVCGVESIKTAGGIQELKEQRRCYEDALDEAVARINNPILTRIHEG